MNKDVQEYLDSCFIRKTGLWKEFSTLKAAVIYSKTRFGLFGCYKDRIFINGENIITFFKT